MFCIYQLEHLAASSPLEKLDLRWSCGYLTVINSDHEMTTKTTYYRKVTCCQVTCCRRCKQISRQNGAQRDKLLLRSYTYVHRLHVHAFRLISVLHFDVTLMFVFCSKLTLLSF